MHSLIVLDVGKKAGEKDLLKMDNTQGG